VYLVYVHVCVREGREGRWKGVGEEWREEVEGGREGGREGGEEIVGMNGYVCNSIAFPLRPVCFTCFWFYTSLQLEDSTQTCFF